MSEEKGNREKNSRFRKRLETIYDTVAFPFTG